MWWLNVSIFYMQCTRKCLIIEYIKNKKSFIFVCWVVGYLGKERSHSDEVVLSYSCTHLTFSSLISSFWAFSRSFIDWPAVQITRGRMENDDVHQRKAAHLQLYQCHCSFLCDTYRYVDVWYRVQTNKGQVSDFQWINEVWMILRPMDSTTPAL